MTGRLVLLRHGQTQGNVDRRLDTRPPGAELTDLGRDQARAFARNLPRPPVLIAHSIATRAVQTAHEINTEIKTTVVDTQEFDGIHEVQVGDLENRSDEAAHDDFKAIYRRWHGGELGLALPGGETAHDVLGRYLPVIEEMRARYLDDDNVDGDIVVVSHGAAIRLVSAVLAGIDGGFADGHHLANTESVVLAPVADNRWSCVRWGGLGPPIGAAPTTAYEPDAAPSTDPMG